MPLLEQLQSALFQQAEFHPQQASATITLGMTDWVEMWLMPQLIPALRERRPACGSMWWQARRLAIRAVWRKASWIWR
ncbi:LysR-family transcriptional regulator [Cronobacter sakazakii 701]|nr:LysR-family transcriptional regulator [Cronobacter sakazakii 701]